MGKCLFLREDLIYDIDLDKILTDARLLEEVEAKLGHEVLHFQAILKDLILKIQALLGHWVAQLFRNFSL